MALPVITVAQMRQWEGATWAAGIKPADVIATAGQCVARAALRLTRAGERILILAGKGHNGDDARAAASGLGERTVEIISVLDPRAAREVFLRQIQADSTAKPAPKPALLIDGIFGIGLNRPLDSEWIALFAALNESGLPILAIDVPSGVNADTGEVLGAALHAAVTLTLGAPKIGLVQARAAAFVGRLEVAANLGLLPCGLHSDLHWTQAADFAAFPPRRPVAGHKGTFGHVGILAGSLGYHGAAVLAARAASRAMPGLVTLFTAEDVFTPVAVQLQNVMVHPGRPSFVELHDYSAVMVGPGLADEKLAGDLRELIAEIWHNLDRPVIADASALDWLPAGATTTTALRVITPHPGEAARMLRVTSAEIQRDRVSAVRGLSARFGNCHVVLKGAQTLVGRANELVPGNDVEGVAASIFLNSSGNPQLAQGGSGDLLAGYLGGLLAQPALQACAPETIRYAVWQHGAAADDLSARRRAWTIEELIPLLGVLP